MHRAPPQTCRLGNRPHAGVAVIGQKPASRVDDLRSVQGRVAALTTLWRVLSQALGILTSLRKWNTLTHLCLTKSTDHVFVASVGGTKWSRRAMCIYKVRHHVLLNVWRDVNSPRVVARVLTGIPLPGYEQQGRPPEASRGSTQPNRRPMPEMTEVYEWHGRNVVGSDGEKIGKLAEIYDDPETGKPEWATVSSG